MTRSLPRRGAMPWLDAALVTQVPLGLQPALAYCQSVEQAFALDGDAVAAPYLDALEVRTKKREEGGTSHDAVRHLDAIAASSGKDEAAWKDIAGSLGNPVACAAVAARILPCAHEPEAPLGPVVHVLTSLLLHCTPSELWDTQATTRRLPVPLLTCLLENPGLDSASPEGLYVLFTLYLESVHAYLAQAYDHALKLLMHYLLESRQQPHEPGGVRRRYRTLGALLLERRVEHALNATLSPSAPPLVRLKGDASVCTVLDLYATPLLAAGATHTRLLRTVGLALAHDAIKAVNACLALPNAAKSVLAVRKKFLQSSHLDRHTDERLYSQVAAEYGGTVHGPSIAANLWHECALALCSDESQVTFLGLYFVRAVSIASLFYPAPVADALAPKRAMDQGEAPAYDAYAAQMLAAVVQTRHAMATISEEFGTASSQGARVAWDAVLGKCVDVLPFLYASESPRIRSGAQPTADVDQGMTFTRFETLHGRFLEDANAAASGVDRFLRTYALVAEHLPSAAYGAPLFLGALDDLLHVFCDHNMGLFLPFVAWHPSSGTVEALGDRAPPPALALWQRASQDLALLFQRVPDWSRSVAREELLAWLPRVPALASFMVKRVSVVVAALGASGDTHWTSNDVVSALSMPLDSAIGWLRLNQKELLQELSDYIRRVVQTFSKASMALPQHVTQRAVDFLTQQIDISTATERKTLLSTAQLELLLDEFLALPKESRAPVPAPAKGKLKQATLSFAPRTDVVDLTGDSPRPNPFRAATQIKSTPKVPKPAPKPGPTSRLSQLRSEFQQTRNTARRPHAPTRQFEADEPRAPLATSSVTGSVIAPPPRPRPEPESATDSSSSDEETTGLGALASPRKPKPEKPAAPVRRSVVLMEDSALQNTMRKARDDGRLRRLRATPDYSELHRCILAWDMDCDADAPPPFASEVLSTKARAVPPKFTTASEYIDVYGALFLKECWAQFQQAREELASADLLPVGVSVGGSVNELVRFDCKVQPPSKWTLSDADVVCLETSDAKETIRLLAKVQNVEGRGRDMRVSVLCHPTTPQQRRAVQLAGSSEHRWRLGKLFSLVTLRREYAALLSAPDLGLAEDILQARAARRAEVSAADQAAAVRKFGVNPPQANAIVGAMRTPGFSLIQGPPGTGKTKTISALVATFLQRRRNGRSGVPAKMLLCAPSNAAIDEIVARIQHGVEVDGRLIQPRLVRIGREDAVNPAVRESTLEAAVERRQGQRQDSAQKQQAARRRLQDIEQQWTQKEQELGRAKDKVLARQLQAELNLLTDQRLEAREENESLARSEKSNTSMSDARRHHVRIDVLSEAEIVCATLAGAGHELLYPMEFDTVVIDEAVQAVELSTLIPLRYNCTRCILVGDPKQLPPTVISQQAEQLGYSQSLFVRMYQQAPQNVYLLSIQYRMHPSISFFPSAAFYGGQLQDGEGMAKRTVQPWHTVPLFAPFRMLDIRSSGEEMGRGHSLVNRAEADAAIALYDSLQTHAKSSLAGRVGFITMYKAQVALMRSLFRARYGAEAVDDATFNTVDGFQGQEKDIIVLSCVRSNARGAIGFLGDQRRLNVALTRARSNMFVLGDATMLERSNPVWERLVREARERGHTVRVRNDTFRIPTRALPEKPGQERDERPAVDAQRARAPPAAQPNGQRTTGSIPAKRPALPSNAPAKPAPAARPAIPTGPAKGTPTSAAPAKPSTGQTVPAKRPSDPTSRADAPTKRPASLPSKPSGTLAPESPRTPLPRAPIPSATPQAKPGATPTRPGKWAAIVARSKEKPTAPRPTPIAPGESRAPSKSEGPSWLRSTRPNRPRPP